MNYSNAPCWPSLYSNLEPSYANGRRGNLKRSFRREVMKNDDIGGNYKGKGKRGLKLHKTGVKDLKLTAFWVNN